MSEADALRNYVQMQEIIQQVLKQHAHRPLAEIIRALKIEMIRRGLQVPPFPWLEAVAGEIAQGRLYVVASALLPNEQSEQQGEGRN